MGTPEITEEEGCGGAWTNEKHTSFLNWMEASFVSWMQFGSRFAYAAATAPLPLDRCLPDGANSTVECRTGKRGRRTAAHPREGRRGLTEGLRRTRQRLQGRYTARRILQDDQVVPEFEAMKGGENGRPHSAPEVVRPAATDDQLPME